MYFQVVYGGGRRRYGGAVRNSHHSIKVKFMILDLVASADLWAW